MDGWMDGWMDGYREEVGGGVWDSESSVPHKNKASFWLSVECQAH